jgi:hypothetical protein
VIGQAQRLRSVHRLVMLPAPGPADAAWAEPSRLAVVAKATRRW